MGEGYGPISNQRILNSTTITLSNGERKTLEPGSFVKAVSKRYLPKGCRFENYDEEREVVVFSYYGLGVMNLADLEWGVY